MTDMPSSLSEGIFLLVGFYLQIHCITQSQFSKPVDSFDVFFQMDWMKRSIQLGSGITGVV